MTELSSGQSLNPRFTLIRPLGRGGTAAAWLVHDAERGEQVVAKIVPPGASPEHVALLERECRHSRRLVHPNIVPVFDLHRGSDGRFFITMAHVDGEDIGKFRGRPPAEIVELLLPLAHALAFAHGRGVVHRDLKAANVICDGSGRPHLLDFGIAFALGEAAASAPLAGWGSRYSASPEQLAGGEPHPSDDIYALGVLLYELITGHPPFWPDPDAPRLRTAIAQPLRSAHAVPARLQALVARMLARDAAGRPPSMGAVVAELEQIRRELQEAPVEGAPAAKPIVRLTPPPRVESIEAIDRPAPASAASSRPARRRGRAGLRAVATGLGLAAGALLLQGFLAGLVERRASARSSGAAVPATVEAVRADVPGTPAAAPPSPPAGERSAHDSARLRAEDALARVVRQQAGLEGQGVLLWGREEYAEACATIREGDGHLLANEHEQAWQAYERAGQLLEGLQSRAEEVLDRELASGAQALAAGDARAAREAFALASGIDASNEAAATGLRRAEVLDQVLALVGAGLEGERRGDLAAAGEAYGQAAALDPFAPAPREALARVRQDVTDRTFSARMSEGLAALDRRDYDAAREAFVQAGKLSPGSAQVAEGLLQVDHALELDDIAARRERAQRLEQSERWREAAAEYDAVLEIDPTILFAQEGRSRCLDRASLLERLDFHLTHPDRLATDAALEEAEELLVDAAATEPAGPLQRERVERLAQLLAAASTRVRVELLSDDLTEVTIYRVAELGAFSRHEIELRPGRYTVVGSRRGYRDVRHELVVSAGSPPEPLLVRCAEKL